MVFRGVEKCAAGSLWSGWQRAVQRRFPQGRPNGKKKARPMGDAPSNRTFGNCLLEVHCSQKDRPGTRAIA
jgi:hypothetical protein